MGDAEAMRRFHAEAEAIARLRHPNIVSVHEIGSVEGRPFFSMDFVPGSTLAKLLHEQPLAPRVAAGYLRSVARAIHYAHGRGVIHRDLKPANILIDQSNEPRVTDFGLAKKWRADSETSSPAAGLTRHGELLGTPSYMAPEQLTGSHGGASPLSDVYSLGAILYHALTGRPPFLAAEVELTFLQVIDADRVDPAGDMYFDIPVRNKSTPADSTRRAVGTDLALI